MDICLYEDPGNFREIFDRDTGLYIRTDILNKDGTESGVQPFMRSFPGLLDIGIMGKCSSSNSCQVGCYQQGSGNVFGTNMPFEFFKKIIDEIKGKTFEVALGGFGNPNEHPDFVDMVRYARINGVVPNYTTAGNRLTEDQIKATKKYCGAVAVSWHKAQYTFDAISRFLMAGVKTNIHFVLGNDSIDEAIERLETNSFPEGINAVIFLLYKPVGKVKSGNVLSVNDERVKKFYSLIESEHPFKCGLDSCHVPGVVNFCSNVLEESISPCDAGRFSMYITPDGYGIPCSFDTTKREWAVDLKESSIKEVWDGAVFSKFREYHGNSCGNCSLVKNCFGGCPLMGSTINLCEREKEYWGWM